MFRKRKNDDESAIGNDISHIVPGKELRAIKSGQHTVPEKKDALIPFYDR